MKKILIFSLSYFPHVGGAEVAVKETTDRITDVVFHMITLRLADEAIEEKVGNVLVHRVGNGASTLQKMLFIPRAAQCAVRLHKEQQFDALWAVMTYMLFPIVLLRMRGVSVPYLLSLQDGDPFEHVFGRPRIVLFRPLLAYGFRHAAAVHAISNYLAAWARRAGFPREPDVIGNGVDVARFSRTPSADELARAREHIGKKKGDVFLVTTSRLVYKNAVDDVIRALELLPEHIHFIIYGIGTDESYLKELARASGVGARTHFLGQISYAEVPLALHASDIFIRPSRTEGFGNSFIEAMAAGVPVVATQEGGIADFLFDAENNPGVPATGWAVAVDSPAQIAKKVREILTRPEETRRVVEIAKRLALEKYSWDRIAEQMGGLFERVYNPSTITS